MYGFCLGAFGVMMTWSEKKKKEAGLIDVQHVFWSAGGAQLKANKGSYPGGTVDRVQGMEAKSALFWNPL